MPTPKFTRIISTAFLRTGYGEEDITEQTFVQAEISYNSEGKVLTEKHFNADESLESAVENEYDAQGLIAVSSQFDETEELCQKNVFEYDEQKNVLKKGCFYGEGSPEYSTRYIYENGLLTREDSYNEDEFDYTEKSYEYDEHGRLKCRTEYDEDSQVMYRYTHDYDDNNRIIKTLFEEVVNKDSRTYTYEYDENGRKVKELTFNFGGKLIAKSYFTYDENGNLLEQEDEDLDNYRLTKYEYADNKCTKVSRFDKQEALLAWAEYEYDEYGEVALVKNYVQDEVRPDWHRSSSQVKYETEWY